MVNDDEMYASFKRLAELGAHRAGPCREWRCGGGTFSAKLLAEGNTGPEAHAYSRPPQVEGEATNRAIMIADMTGVPLVCRAYLLRGQPRGDSPCPDAGQAGLGRAADPASDAGRKRVFQQGLGPCRAPRDVAAVPQQAASGLALGRVAVGVVDVLWRPIIARSPPSRNAPVSAISPRSRTAPAGWRTGCRCSGRMA